MSADCVTQSDAPVIRFARHDARLAVLELPPALLGLPARAWWPWKPCPETGRPIVHVSTLLALSASGRKIAPKSRADAEWWRGYLRECRDGIGPLRLRRHGDGYDWSRGLTAAWKPMAFQVAGMDRLWARITGPLAGGVCLGDEVGLGKTVQAIGVLQRAFITGAVSASAPVVVVTDSILKSQWADEYEKFARPSRKVSVVDGERAERFARMKPGREVYVLNYAMLHLPQYAAPVGALCARAGAVVLDESSRIKNPQSQTFLAARTLFARTPIRMAFNATPIEGHLQDLWSQHAVLDRYAIGDYAGFCDRYLTVDFYGKVVRYHNIGEFKRRIMLSSLRRRRSECAVDMPKVRAVVRPVELSPKQAAAYRVVSDEYVTDKSVGAVAIAKLAAVQFAAFAARMDDPASPCAKLDDLAELLRGELSAERVVVFSRFRTVIEFAARRLSEFSPQCITGKTSKVDRAAARRRFSNTHGAGRLLLGTEAMDRGLNLQAAGVVVNLDLPWTIAKLKQRIGRVARIGQSRASVLVINYRAVLPGSARPTIDDWFLQTVLPAKRDLVESLLGKDDVDDVGDRAHDPASIRKFLGGA